MCSGTLAKAPCGAIAAGCCLSVRTARPHSPLLDTFRRNANVFISMAREAAAWLSGSAMATVRQAQLKSCSCLNAEVLGSSAAAARQGQAVARLQLRNQVTKLSHTIQ